MRPPHRPLPGGQGGGTNKGAPSPSYGGYASNTNPNPVASLGFLSAASTTFREASINTLAARGNPSPHPPIPFHSRRLLRGAFEYIPVSLRRDSRRATSVWDARVNIPGFCCPSIRLLFRRNIPEPSSLAGATTDVSLPNVMCVSMSRGHQIVQHLSLPLTKANTITTSPLRA